jgi:hypothetical protein
MAYLSCPSVIVNAPVEIVWTILVSPEKWSDVFDLRIVSVEPPGPAVVGQVISGETGPRVWHLTIKLRFVKIDAVKCCLGLDVQLPFDITVREQLSCTGFGPDQCRVTYNCDFDFPAGWRGALIRFFLRNRFDSGPADSLSRLQRAAERQFGLSAVH